MNSSDQNGGREMRKASFKCSSQSLKLVKEVHFLLAESTVHHFHSIYGLLSTIIHVYQAHLGFLYDCYFCSFAWVNYHRQLGQAYDQLSVLRAFHLESQSYYESRKDFYFLLPQLDPLLQLDWLRKDDFSNQIQNFQQSKLHEGCCHQPQQFLHQIR